MSKFTVKKNLINVELEYIELEEGEIILANNLVNKDRYKEKIKKATASFERPNWGNFNKYIKGCIDIDPVTATPYIDSVSLRDKKFRNLLKKLVDGDGESIQLDNQFFNNVIPEFAIALVEAYDEKLDEEKQNAIKNDSFIKNILEEAQKELDKEVKDKLNSDEQKEDE